MRITRRTWLSFLGRAVKATAGAGFVVAAHRLLHRGPGRPSTQQPRVDEREEFVLRPPGALPEPEFLARCIHCSLCQDACPAGCIQMKPDAEADRYTPFVTPRWKACTLCLRCGEVCPTGALQTVARKEDVRMGVARVDEESCVSHRRTGACGACFTACPLRGRAITQGLYNAPTVHPEFCVGCGLCEEVCIVSFRAIRVFPRSDDRGPADSVSPREAPV